jgi:PKD repeat protein
MRQHRWALGLVCLVALGISGCSAIQVPRASFSVVGDPGYAPLTILFDASASSSPGAEPLLYEWSFGDGTSDVGDTVQHVYFTKGNYEATLHVTDGLGRQATARETIHVLNRIPTASFTVDPYQAPRDYPFQFDASASTDADGEIVSYVWTFGDGTGAEGVVVEHVFPEERVKYPVILTVTDNDGASDQTMRYVEPIGCDTCG